MARIEYHRFIARVDGVYRSEESAPTTLFTIRKTLEGDWVVFSDMFECEIAVFSKEKNEEEVKVLARTAVADYFTKIVDLLLVISKGS